MAPIVLATALTTLLAASPTNTEPPVEMSLTLGISNHSQPDSSSAVIPMATLSLSACLADSLVLDLSTGWFPFAHDYAALGGWNWRVFGAPRTDFVVDLRALAGAHLLTEDYGNPPQSIGVTAAAELALTNWSYSRLVALHTRLRAGVETTGTGVYPTALVSLGAAF
jgi:hypothetical protein